MEYLVRFVYTSILRYPISFHLLIDELDHGPPLAVYISFFSSICNLYITITVFLNKLINGV